MNLIKNLNNLNCKNGTSCLKVVQTLVLCSASSGERLGKEVRAPHFAYSNVLFRSFGSSHEKAGRRGGYLFERPFQAFPRVSTVWHSRYVLMQSYCPFEAYTTTAWCSVASRAKAANAVGFGESRYCLIPLGIFRLNAHSRSIAVWSARPRMLTMSEDFEGLPWLPGPNVPPLSG